MSVRLYLARLAQILGYAWIAVVVAFGAYVGFMGVFFRMPGLLNQEGYGDIYVLALVASPGLALVWWGNRVMKQRQKQPQEAT